MLSWRYPHPFVPAAKGSLVLLSRNNCVLCLEEFLESSPTARISLALVVVVGRSLAVHPSARLNTHARYADDGPGPLVRLWGDSSGEWRIPVRRSACACESSTTLSLIFIILLMYSFSRGCFFPFSFEVQPFFHRWMMRFFFVSYPFVRLIVFLPQSGCPEKNSATGRHHFLSEDASCLATDSFFFCSPEGWFWIECEKKITRTCLM